MLVKKTRGFATAIEVRETRRVLQFEWNRFRNEECALFFKNLNSFNYSERVKQTCKFIRGYRKKAEHSITPSIPLSSWVTVLKNTEGLNPPLIPETDQVPVSAPPTELELYQIISGMTHEER